MAILFKKNLIEAKFYDVQLRRVLWLVSDNCSSGICKAKDEK